MGHDPDTDVPAGNRGEFLSRRSLFQRAGLLIAAAALPPGMGMAESSASPAGEGVSPVMAKLSAYMSEARGRALPDEVMEKAKQHILGFKGLSRVKVLPSCRGDAAALLAHRAAVEIRKTAKRRYVRFSGFHAPDTQKLFAYYL
jgi:hypothetical protein